LPQRKCCGVTRTRTASQRTDGRKRREVEVEGGITVSPVPLTMGERVTVKYQGLLAQSGAEQLYLHKGYGPGHSWSSIEDLPMQKNNGVWEVQFVADNASRLNFCFKDNAENWDNNNGRNWSLEIHSGEIP